ncbi:pilin [Candidatus Gracilibacteria bacterium]|nr:pilin [Candidatus Gracilibacteria bacterium]
MKRILLICCGLLLITSFSEAVANSNCTDPAQAKKNPACLLCQEGESQCDCLKRVITEVTNQTGCYCEKVTKNVNGEQKEITQWYLYDPNGNPTKKETKYCVVLQESLPHTKGIAGETGVDLIGNYVQEFYKYGASIVGIICVLIIVISGVQIMMGGAEQELVTQAKTRIFQAIASLLILFLSAAILVAINPGFFGGQ